jgi:A/G-specific adenine glycosylase
VSSCSACAFDLTQAVPTTVRKWNWILPGQHLTLRETRLKQPSPKSKSNQLTRRLIDWFAANARDLPWRHTSDPYAIWVSEIMLQQTQVKTVIPYFERWMKAVPDVQRLSRLSSNRLHKLWEGLGYYTRARNLQKAARQIVSDHGGVFPDSFDDILNLPGIGRYTVGAVGSMAFNQRVPLVDGNVIRVLSRLFGIRGNPKDKQVAEQFWEKAGELVAAAGRLRTTFRPRNSALMISGNCSALNQSLMELGATICTPRNPNCGTCPVAKLCDAKNNDHVDELPEVVKPTRATARRFVAFIVQRGLKFLIRQRPPGVVNAHLWEFPNAEVSADEKDPVQSAADQLGFQAVDTECCATLKHSITRYRITLECHRLKNPEARTLPVHGFYTREQIGKFPFTAAHQKLLQYL